MIRPGLTSVTFRKLPPAEVIRWAAKGRLDGIEWGGDVHVPPGRADAARAVAARTRDAGLAVSSYGSYYRVGHDEPEAFAPVLETAVALGAPIVRVWAGKRASADADDAYRAQVADDGRRIAELAGRAGIIIATEWHGNTLTDTAESAAALFAAVGNAAFKTYWQPPGLETLDACLADLDAALPRLVGLHVHHWGARGHENRPLANAAAAWRAFLAKAAAAGDLFALLEFVLNDDPDQMLLDAAALREWIEAAGRP